MKLEDYKKKLKRLISLMLVDLEDEYKEETILSLNKKIYEAIICIIEKEISSENNDDDFDVKIIENNKKNNKKDTIVIKNNKNQINIANDNSTINTEQTIINNKEKHKNKKYNFFK